MAAAAMVVEGEEVVERLRAHCCRARRAARGAMCDMFGGC